MKYISQLSLILLLQHGILLAQRGDGYNSMNGLSTEQVDAFSMLGNPAAIAQVKQLAAGIYGERKFMLDELNHFDAACAIPASPGSFGIRLRYDGFSDFNESQIGVVYGRRLGQRFDLGAAFSYHRIRIAGYGSTSTVTVSIGAVLHVTDRFNVGIAADNPAARKFGHDEKLPSVFTYGIGYDASSRFFISAAIEKEEDQHFNVNAGLQYRFLPQLLIRAGIASATSSGWIGLGVVFKKLRIDVTTGYNPSLGLTPGLMLLLSSGSATTNNSITN